MARDRAQHEWLTAQDCAQRIGLTVKALRLYEDHGLVRPRRTEKGWRLYGADEIARLHEVLALKRLGLSLARITELLQGRAVDLDHTLAMQEALLSEQHERAARGLTLVAAARTTLARGDRLDVDQLVKLAKEANMTEAPTDLIARRRYEQARPRKAAHVDPATFDRFAGCYRFASGLVATIEHRDGGLFMQLPGQPACELFAEATGQFFLRITPAQVTFRSDGAEPAVALDLHQGGQIMEARRIAAAEAAAVASALQGRIDAKQPQPGSEALLRELLAEHRQGRAAAERLSAELAAVVAEQLPVVAQELDARGDLRRLKFKGVDAGGTDIYEDEFEKGKLSLGIGLTEDGRAHTLWLVPAM